MIELYLNNNRFNSLLPHGLGSMTSLHIFDASSNMLSGTLPHDLGRLRKLRFLSLAYNHIAGRLPASLFNCSSLTHLYLDGNILQGELTPELGNISTLRTLGLSSNRFTGMIPSQLSSCVQLEQLWLGRNDLQGSIPEAFGNIPSLFILSLGSNHLEGKLQANLGNCTALSLLSLCQNNLAGELPLAWQNLKNLVMFFLQNNNVLTGSIPPWVGNLKLLRILDLSNNAFSGFIPPELGGIANVITSTNPSTLLQHIFVQRAAINESILINLSRNNLSGKIPKALSMLRGSVFLNLSQNHLCGPIPSQLLNQFFVIDLSYNPFCGFSSVRTLADIAPAGPSGKPGLSSPVTGVITGIAVFSFIVALSGVLLICCKSLRKMLHARVTVPETSIAVPRIRRGVSKAFDPSLRSISMADLLNATENFDKARVIGDGGFGLVYNATLPDGRQLAVKRLSTDGCQGKREFQAEMATLGKIRHRNLVELLAYCEAGEDKILVYGLMENGSLDMWLHEKEDGPHILHWKRRLQIAQGSARGLAFLHHECEPHIIHRDIKSSNILLDRNFESRIADFGLARSMNPMASHVSTEVAGTLGYMAPEYAMSLAATLKADVYSFGMLMLEMATGRRPNICIKERNLRTVVNWARALYQEGKENELLDSHLKDAAPVNEVKEYFRIACKCTEESPDDRPTMEEVAHLLGSIGSQDIQETGCEV